MNESAGSSPAERHGGPFKFKTIALSPLDQLLIAFDLAATPSADAILTASSQFRCSSGSAKWLKLAATSFQLFASRKPNAFVQKGLYVMALCSV